jgi:FkbM family methyltransferase
LTYNFFIYNPSNYKVQSITLKEIFDKFNINLSECVLKLDIEGMEYFVLNDLILKNTLPSKNIL